MKLTEDEIIYLLFMSADKRRAQNAITRGLVLAGKLGWIDTKYDWITGMARAKEFIAANPTLNRSINAVQV